MTKTGRHLRERTNSHCQSSLGKVDGRLESVSREPVGYARLVRTNFVVVIVLLSLWLLFESKF